jgi:tetratricopeptide (TPR) repeat protein
MDTLNQAAHVFDTTTITGPALEALYAIAYSFLDIERIEDAVRAFRVMVRFAPTDERAWLGLGTCHEKLGQEDIAAELYGAGSVVAEPPSARCLIALARLLRVAGDGASALEHVDHALAFCDSIGDEAFAETIRDEWRTA